LKHINRLCGQDTGRLTLNKIITGFSNCRAVTGKGKGKGKAIPLEAWTGPKGSRRLSGRDFKTVGT
jgi:hypothetical protein